MTKKKVREAIDFLPKYSLIIEDEFGKLKIGPTLIHLDSSSSQIPRSHQNWLNQIKDFHQKNCIAYVWVSNQFNNEMT